MFIKKNNMIKAQLNNAIQNLGTGLTVEDLSIRKDLYILVIKSMDGYTYFKELKKNVIDEVVSLLNEEDEMLICSANNKLFIIANNIIDDIIEGSKTAYENYNE